MAIRFVDKVGRVARLAVTLEGVSGLFQGTRTAPAGRTGVISAIAGAVSAILQGQSFSNTNRTGVISTSLENAQSSMVGSSTPPAGAALGFLPDAGYSAVGTWGIGNTITVTKSGGGFGTKPKGGKPWAYFPHTSGLAPDTTLSRCAVGNVDNGSLNTFVTGVGPLNSPGSRRVQMTDANATWGAIFQTPTMEVSVFTHRKFNYDVLHDGVASNLKMIRARASINNGVPNTYVVHPFSVGTPGSSRIMVGSSDVGNTPSGLPYHVGALSNEFMSGYSSAVFPDGITTQWHTHEAWFRSSTAPNAANGQIVSWINGARVLYYPETVLPGVRDTAGFITNDDPNFVGWNSLYQCQISNNVEPNDYFYYGPTVIDDSLHGLFLTDEATWNTSAAVAVSRDFLIPLTWADLQISFHVRQTFHPSQVGKWVWARLGDGMTMLRLGQVVSALTDGGDAIITGAGFGSNANVQQEFLGGVDGEIESRANSTTWASVARPGWTFPGNTVQRISTNRSYNGTKSLANLNYSTSNYQFGSKFDTGGYKTIFNWHSVYMRTTETYGQLKDVRWVGGPLASDQGLTDDNQPNVYFTDYSQSVIAINGGRGTGLYPNPTLWASDDGTPTGGRFFVRNGWYRQERMMVSNTIGSAFNGSIKFRSVNLANGAVSLAREWTALNLWNTGLEARPFQYVTYQGFFGNEYVDPGNEYYWDRDIYIAWNNVDYTKPKFVLLGNAPTYAACDRRLFTICLWRTWADNQIRFKVNKGVHPNLSSVYAYVMADVDTPINTVGLVPVPA